MKNSPSPKDRAEMLRDVEQQERPLRESLRSVDFGPQGATAADLVAYASRRGIDPDLPDEEKRAILRRGARLLQALDGPAEAAAERFAFHIESIGDLECKTLAVSPAMEDVNFRVSLGDTACTIRVVLSEVMAPEPVMRVHARLAARKAWGQLRPGGPDLPPFVVGVSAIDHCAIGGTGPVGVDCAAAGGEA